MTSTVERRNRVPFYRNAFAWRATVLKRALRRNGFMCDDDEVNRELRDAPSMDAAYAIISARRQRHRVVPEPRDIRSAEPQVGARISTALPPPRERERGSQYQPPPVAIPRTASESTTADAHRSWFARLLSWLRIRP